MPVPFEDTNTLPKDADGTKNFGLWDAVNSRWKAWKGDPNGRAHVILYDTVGNPLLTVANPGIVTIQGALPAGTNNIGDVDVLTLPAIPAGNNNIGDVDIASIAVGANIIGKVGIDQTTPGVTNLVDTELPAAGAAADAVANPTAPFVQVAQSLFNGVTWDRKRSNYSGTLLSSAARTATTQSANQTNHNFRGVMVLFAVSAAGTGNLNPHFITGFAGDPDSLTIDLHPAGALVTNAGRNLYVLYPGNTEAEGALFYGTLRVASPMPLPRTWRFEVVHSDGSVWTYQADFHYIL